MPDNSMFRWFVQVREGIMDLGASVSVMPRDVFEKPRLKVCNMIEVKYVPPHRRVVKE
jgi:hypothetical protein